MKTPCIKVCIMDEQRGVCRGCCRTLEEIAHWGQMSHEERERVMSELPARKGVSGQMSATMDSNVQKGRLVSAMAAVAEVLGGRKTLGARPKTALEWQEVILAGVPVAAAEALKTEIAVADRPFAELIGISEKTLSRARAGKGKLDPVVSDRLFRLARIVTLAIDVLEGEEPAVHWLKRPQFGLGGRTPLSLLATDAGRDEVEKLLLRIEHGVYT